MSKRKAKPPISDLLRQKIVDSGIPYMVLQRETGVERTCIMRFVKGVQTMRLDKAEALAEYFGLELVERKAK